MAEENKVITNNIGEIFLLKDGTAKNPLNLNDYHPLSTTNGLLVHIEDGLPTNIVTTTYKPQNMSDFVTHEFPLFFRGMIEKKVYGATRVFAQYFTWVPTILLARNKNKDNLMGVDLTVTQTTGANLLGGFDTLLQLNSEHPPTVELADERAIAYVIDNNDKGFYNVVFAVDSYVWAKIIMPLAYYDIDVKQYNTFEIIVQKGHAPSSAIPITISDEIVRLLYQEIARINSAVAENEENIGLIDDRVAIIEEIGIPALQSSKLDKESFDFTNHFDIENEVQVYAVDKNNQQIRVLATPVVAPETVVLRDDEGKVTELEEHKGDIQAHKPLFDAKLNKENVNLTNLEQDEDFEVYAINKSNQQVRKKAVENATPNTIVRRDIDGNIFDLIEHEEDNQAHKSLFDEKLSRDGTLPMLSDLNLNGNDIQNVDEIEVEKLTTLGSEIEVASDLNLKGNAIKHIANATQSDQAIPKGQAEGLIGIHNTDNTAHLYIRQLIEALEREIARLDSKGKSYGVVDKTQSELLGMTQGDRNTYILTFLQNKYSGYTNENGNLIYTKTVVGENEHEWEFNGTNWVDNGAWTIEKASNSEYGLIKGDGVYLSVVSGLVQVLLSDKSKKVINADDSAYLDYVALKAAVDELDNIYRKADVYTKLQIDTLLNQLKTVYGWNDTLLGDLMEGSIPINGYDYILVQAIGSVTTDAKFIEVSNFEEQSDIRLEHAAFERMGNNVVLKNSTANSVLVFGIKMEKQLAENIDYENTDVANKLKELEDLDAVLGLKKTLLGDLNTDNIMTSGDDLILIKEVKSGKVLTKFVDLSKLSDGYIIQLKNSEVMYSNKELMLDGGDVENLFVYGLSRPINADEIDYESVDVKGELNRNRGLGGTVIERNSYGVVIKVLSDYGETSVARDSDGVVEKIIEIIGLDEYNTTFEKDVYGNVIKINKEKVN